MKLAEVINNSITTQKQVLSDLHQVQNVFSAAVAACRAALRNGHTLFFCGNGGSAADAQHIAAEFVGRFKAVRAGLCAESLSCNTSIITAIANDFSYEEIFSRQVEARVRPGDVLVGFTTSGRSENVLKAFNAARKRKTVNALFPEIVTICFTGADAPVELNTLVDFCIRVPSNETPRIQECHIFLGHVMVEYIEMSLQERVCQK